MDLLWTLSLLAVVAIVLWIIQYYTSRRYKLLSAIPSCDFLMLLNIFIDFLTAHPDEIIDIMIRLFNRTSDKKLLYTKIGPSAFVFIRNIPDVEKLLTDNQQLRKAENYLYLKPWLGKGLINSEGELWQKHRKMITPTFHFKILERYHEVVISNVEILTELLEQKVGKECFDIEPFIANYSLDIIAETSMSATINAQTTNSKFIECIKSLTEIIIIRTAKVLYFFQAIFNLSSYRRIEAKSIKYVNNYIEKILVKNRRDFQNKTIKFTDDETGAKPKNALLDMLLKIQSENADLTDKEIFDEVNTFMFAGHDTVSSALSFLLYVLSVHQDIQENVYTEIIEVLGDSKPTYQSLMNLKYLERVIKETLRLYPPVPCIGRQLKKDFITTEGLVIPEGTNVAVFIYFHHRDPTSFPDPENFNPDRFLPDKIAERHPFAYIPFSAGSRNCIGQKFAMLELLETVSHLLRRFHITPEPGFLLRPITHIVLRPNAKGVRVRLHKR